MKWVFKKLGVLLMSCCMIVFISCSTDSDSEADVIEEEDIPEVNLVLKKVNFQFGGDTPYFIEFSEAGLPVSGDSNTYSYDSEKRLIENTYIGVWGVLMPKSYTYEEDMLVGMNVPFPSGDGGVFVGEGDVIYEEGNKVIHNYINLEYGLSYTFTDDTYNHILSLGLYDGLNSNNFFKRYDYVYDSEMILLTVNEFDIDEASGEEIHKYTYDIEYDTKWNPYYKFKDHHPIVFNLLPFDFDSPTINFIEPFLRRNAKHNVDSILRRIPKSEDIDYTFTFGYEYNEDDYPILRTRYNWNGTLLNIIAFEYY